MHFLDLLSCFRNKEFATRCQLFFVLGQTFRIWRVCSFFCERIGSSQQDKAQADDGYRDDVISHSLTLLLRCAAWSFLMSSGASFGRSIVSVILLSLPVNANGTW